MDKISKRTRVIICPDTIINIIDGESVLLNLQNETYYGLDNVGTDMWNALTAAASTQEAYESLLNEYDVTPDQLRDDLVEFMGKLTEQGLLELQSSV